MSKMQIRKNWEIYKTGIKKASAYKTMTAASLGSTILYVVLLLAVWTAISKSADLEGGLSRVISYVILGQVLNSSIATGIEQWFGYKIRKGTITNELKRPISVLKQAYLHEVGWQTFDTLLKSLPLLIIGLLLTNLQIPSIPNLIGFIISWILSFHLMLSVALSTSMLVFWTKIDNGIRFTRSSIVKFLSGAVFPLYLLPENLKPIFFSLPFHLLIDGPINVFLMRRNGLKILELIGHQIVWILVFLLVTKVLWYKAKRKLTVQGG